MRGGGGQAYAAALDVEVEVRAAREARVTAEREYLPLGHGVPHPHSSAAAGEVEVHGGHRTVCPHEAEEARLRQEVHVRPADRPAVVEARYRPSKRSEERRPDGTLKVGRVVGRGAAVVALAAEALRAKHSSTPHSVGASVPAGRAAIEREAEHETTPRVGRVVRAAGRELVNEARGAICIGSGLAELDSRPRRHSGRQRDKMNSRAEERAQVWRCANRKVGSVQSPEGVRNAAPRMSGSSDRRHRNDDFNVSRGRVFDDEAEALRPPTLLRWRGFKAGLVPQQLRSQPVLVNRSGMHVIGRQVVQTVILLIGASNHISNKESRRKMRPSHLHRRSLVRIDRLTFDSNLTADVQTGAIHPHASHWSTLFVE